ncbi:MAG: hypothetical protein J6D08_13290 [Lachnospiraceae bacterium]|nr:hypothetical protein [Lachnospiraceae bacterium]
MAILTQGELRIRSAVPITDVQKFHMKIDRNTHAVLYMEGTISEKEVEDALLQPLAGTPVMAGAGDIMLFAGILKEVQVIREGTEYHVLLTAVSSTEQLDNRKKNRSFQNVSMTYKEVMEQVLADTPGTNLWFHGADQAIQRPLYQVEETDWEFLKRLAGRLHTVLVPSVYSIAACVHNGMPEGNADRADSKAVCEKIWSDSQNRSVCRRICTSQNWEIGDKIDWEGYRYIVSSKECCLEKGLLQFHYTLAGEAAFQAEQYENPYLTGLLLLAVVLDVKEEQVKVKFDMDSMQPTESAYWYPWQPDIGNLGYCMPEKGEQIYIYIGNAADRQDRAVCGIRRNGGYNPELENMNRYFTTKNRKRMYLTPNAVGFCDLKQKKPLQMELNDNTGANIISRRSLTIAAKDTIGLKGGSILLQAPKEISLVRKALSPTVINMCNGFDTVGAADKVVMEGAGEDNFPVFYQSGEQDGAEFAFSEPEKIEKSIIGSTPALELADSMAWQLEGCRVKQLG